MDGDNAVPRQRSVVDGMLAVRRRSLTRSSSELEQKSDHTSYTNMDGTTEAPKRSLKPDIFGSNTEKEAFRKNLIIEKRLNSELDDIRLHRAHLSRVINCDAIRFKQHTSRFPRLASLRVGGWELSGKAINISRRNSYSGRTSTPNWPEFQTVGSGTNSNRDTPVKRHFGGVTVSHIVAPQLSDDFPVLRTPLQRRYSEGHCPRSSSVRLRKQSWNVAETKMEPEYIRIPSGKTSSVHASESDTSQKDASVDHVQGEHLRSIGDKGSRRVNTTEDGPADTELSSHFESSKEGPNAKKTVRWGEPEVMFLRSSTAAAKSHKSLSPSRPILNLKAALSCERLKYQNSQAKVALYMQQLASCGFSSKPEKRILSAETSE